MDVLSGKIFSTELETRTTSVGQFFGAFCVITSIINSKTAHGDLGVLAHDEET